MSSRRPQLRMKTALAASCAAAPHGRWNWAPRCWSLLSSAARLYNAELHFVVPRWDSKSGTVDPVTDIADPPPTAAPLATAPPQTIPDLPFDPPEALVVGGHDIRQGGPPPPR